MPQPLDQITQMTSGQITVLVALIAVPSAAIAAIVTGIFGLIQGRAIRRADELRMNHTLEAEQRKFIATLAVQMAVEEYRALLNQAIKQHELECAVAQRNGMMEMPELDRPLMDEVVEDMTRCMISITSRLSKRTDSKN